VDTSTRNQLAAGLIAALLLGGMAQARPKNVASNELQASAAVSSDDGTNANDADDCPDTANTIAARVGSRVKVLETTHLRSRLGHESSRDVRIARSTFVQVEASDDQGHWVLVDDGFHHAGWVRTCEVAGVRRHVDDEVEVTRGGSLRSGVHGRSVMKLAKGALLTVVDWRDDSVLVTAFDGVRGWYPAARLRTASERTTLLHPGVGVEWPCERSQYKRADSIRCGELELRVLAVVTTKPAPKLLLGSEDGRWGWTVDRVTPVASVDNTALSAAPP
jgi:hypothetical protein